MNPNDSSAFSRAINYPKRGIGDKTIEKIITFARENDFTLIEASDLKSHRNHLHHP